MGTRFLAPWLGLCSSSNVRSSMNDLTHICPDCGVAQTIRNVGMGAKAPIVCSECLKLAVPEPPGGWAVESRWIGGVRGRGVFAREPFNRGDTIERCWVMPLTPEESTQSLSMPVLNRYLFPWVDNLRVIVSGNGLLYNFDRLDVSRREPNTECVLRRGISALEFRALRDIQTGEELTWDYQKARVKPR